MALKLFLRVESQVDGQPPQVAGDYLFDRSAFGTQQPTYQYPTDPIRNFRRLIFVNPETQSELITFDAIPGDARNVVQVVSGDDDGGASHFVVDCAMRCRILDDSETLLLHAEIARMPEVKPSNLGFRSLRFKNSAGAGPEVCPHGGDFSSIRGKLDSLAQNPLTVSPVLAAGPSPVESQMHVQFAAGLVTLVRLDRGSHSFLAFKRMCQATPDRPLPFRIVQGNVMAYERPVDDAADMPAAESIVEFRIPGEAMRNSWNGQVQAPYVSALHTVAATKYKRLIAYAALNHGGVIAVGLALGGDTAYGVILYAVSNAFIKAILFLTAGKIRSHYQTDDLREVGGLIKDLPYSGAFFMVGVFALLGLPPFGSFLGELIILSGLIRGGFISVFSAFCVILTVTFVATGRAVFPMIWGESKKRVNWASQPLTSVLPKLLFFCALVAMGLYLPPSVNALFRQVAAGLGVSR